MFNADTLSQSFPQKIPVIFLHFFSAFCANGPRKVPRVRQYAFVPGCLKYCFPDLALSTHGSSLCPASRVTGSQKSLPSPLTRFSATSPPIGPPFYGLITTLFFFQDGFLQAVASKISPLLPEYSGTVSRARAPAVPPDLLFSPSPVFFIRLQAFPFLLAPSDASLMNQYFCVLPP